MADFTTVKAYSAQTAESAPDTQLSSYVPIQGKPKQQNRTRWMEFRLGGSPATTGSPTAVTISIWRLNRTDLTKDPIYDWTINATDITAGKVQPVIVETWGNEVMTQVTFTGGTAPTFTGTIQARCNE